MVLGRWIVFFTLNALIFLTWFGLLNRRGFSASTRFLMAFVLSTAQILGSIFFLGLPWAKLTAINLVLFNGVLSGALLVVAARRRLLLAPLRDIGTAMQDVLATIRSGTAVIKILALLVAITIIWTVFTGVLYPPVEWDSLMYHLPAVGHYMQQQSIADPPLPMTAYSDTGIDGSVWVNSFPKNIELFFLWATILPGSDTIVDLVELVFAFAGALAVYILARRFNVSRLWAVTAGFLYFLTPIVIAQSRSGLIDVSTNALILTVLALLYRQSGERRFEEVVVAGVAMGIVLGAKWSALLILPILLSMLIGQRIYWNRRDRRPVWLPVVKESASFLLPALLFGFYWYAKNWYLYGNPLWPFPITLFGRELFAGVITQEAVLIRTFPKLLEGMNAAQMLWVSWSERLFYGYNYDMRLGGLGPFWFILGIPATVYAVRWIVRRRDWAGLLVFLAAGLILVFHPENWWTRFTMYIAGLGAVAFAMIRSADHRPEVTRLVDITLVIIVVYSTFASLTTSYYQPDRIEALLAKRPELRTSASVRPEVFSQAYDYIVRATVDKPANIAFSSGLDFTYPLWGPRLRNRVYYLEANNLSSWVGKMREKRIKYLFISKNSPEQLLVDRSSLFSRVYFDRRWSCAVYIFQG